ncbi:Gip [Trypoxylus dichotomus]
MFLERPFLERYQLAKNAGFKAVESGFPYGLNPDDVVAAKKAAGIDQVLLNIYTGDVGKGELGFAALPGQEKQFKESINQTIDLGKRLKVKKIHIMAGKVEQPTSANDTAYTNNLKYASQILEKENILGLIEPINPYSVPDYYMNSYKKAVKVISEISSPNLKLMLDIFHLQMIRGNVTNAIKDFTNQIGHVQIAQAPNRHEPEHSGELNYQYVLKTLEEHGYDDWIGLEYKPANSTVDGLQWVKNFGYSL